MKTALARDVRPVYDIVLLTCKAYDFESAVDAIVPAMRRPCAVLPLMNDISHFACLDEKFGTHVKAYEARRMAGRLPGQ